MAKIFKSVTELIGKTPLFEFSNIEKELKVSARVLGKLEFFNPAGSTKDRAALYMIRDGIEKGLIKSDTVILEPTSGNTGIGLCSIGASMGLRTIIVMPDTMSKERIMLMKAYGGEVILSDGSLGMSGAIEKAKELSLKYPSSFIPSQFENKANPLAHKETTGPEIYCDTDGNLDIFVAGVGTGGTLTGVAEFLKEKNPNIKIVAVEPKSSPLLSGGEAGPHGLQGIGANFVPQILNTEIIDEIIPVSEEEAFSFAKLIGKKEGILVGISSGAAAYAAFTLAKREENKGKTIVCHLPDTGDRYLSGSLFE